jgi:hypothetical protein
VVVFLLVQWVDSGEVISDGGYMVGYDVYHDPNVHRVSGIDKSLQGIFTSEVGVDLFPVSGPVSMVPLVKVVNNGRNPYGIEAKIFYVLELLSDSIKVSTTIVVEVASGLVSAASLESISKDLIDVSSLPFSSRFANGDCTNEGKCRKSSNKSSLHIKYNLIL